MSSCVGFCFLSLPKELRDAIYTEYFLEEGGYHFEYASGKLRADNNRPIDLNLMYVCTAITEETRGIALQLNTVTFSTHFSELESRIAGDFQLALHDIEFAKRLYLHRTGHVDLRSFRTPEIAAQLKQEYPQCMATPGAWGITSPWDDGAKLQLRRFTDRALQLLSQHPDFIEALANEHLTDEHGWNQDHRPWRPDFVRSRYFFSQPDPWTIMSENDLADLAKALERPDGAPNIKHQSFGKRVKWRWSAAAVSIRFLQSMSPSARLQLRNIVLLEDRPAVAYPECKLAYGNNSQVLLVAVPVKQSPWFQGCL